MGKKNKGNKKKEKQAEKKRQLEIRNKQLEAEKAETQLVQSLVDNANAVKDILAPFQAFKRCVRKQADLDLDITYVKSGPELGKELLAWAFDLAKSNMQKIYDATEDMKWDSKVKREELADTESRYLLVSTHKEGREGLPTAKECVGFIHLRFEVEEEEPVVYVYELQLSPKVRRGGLGKHLMSLVELVAWKNDMDKVMLTVQKTNPEAVKFYKKLKYTPDECDPELCEPDMEYGYNILSKERKTPRVKAAIARPSAHTIDTEHLAGKGEVEDAEEDSDMEDSDEGDSDEDDSEYDEADVMGDMGAMIRQMMEEDGPVVSLVVLEPDGRVVQLEVDMSPKKNSTGDLLGGGGTFLGQWEDEVEGDEKEDNDDDAMSDDDDGEIAEAQGSAVICMVNRDQAKLPPNKHQLPAPLHEEKVHGKVLLIRMDQNAVPEDFTKAEYEALVKRQAVSVTG